MLLCDRISLLYIIPISTVTLEKQQISDDHQYMFLFWNGVWYFRQSEIRIDQMYFMWNEVEKSWWIPGMLNSHECGV